MAKKSGTAPRRVVPDWSWVGTEVKTAQEITPEHRRRAAGLVGGKSCRYQYGDKADGFEVKDSQCSEKRCKGNPRCLNYLGAEELVDPEAKAAFVEETLGPEPEVRSGPAGLRNLGATCYANAFLQLWFHNIPFRNGVYSCLTPETSSLYNLALVFASLQHTEKQVVDPSGLVKALRLESGNQQDAAEFSKLFMSLIQSEFATQVDPAVRTLVQDLFEGKMEYVTKCQSCNYRSATTNTFLELEVSLKNGSSLQQRLEAMLVPELLDGANKYRCPQCNDLRPATRQTKPSSLPRFIHFSLLRFEYDQKSGSRKKVKASISYPKKLQLGGQEYELCGVITHEGSHAHHGHFICELWDEQAKEWYICNDEEVTVKSEPAKKKLKLSTTGTLMNGNDDETSKDAYMLVYKRLGSTEPIKPPKGVLEAVEAENAAFLKDVEERAKRREAAETLFEDLKANKIRVLDVLPGVDNVVPRDALSAWIRGTSQDDLAKGIDYDSIQCEHGAIDPNRSSDTRLISSAAHTLLSRLTTSPDMDICVPCIEREFAARISVLDRKEQVAQFDALTDDALADDAYLVPKSWINLWRRNALKLGVTPAHEDHTLFCEHDKPIENRATKVVAVSPAQLMLLRSAVGDFAVFKEGEPLCEECEEVASKESVDAEQWRTEIKRDKPIKRQFNLQPHAYGIDYYALPPKFANQWQRWFTEPGPRPIFGPYLCEHGKIDFDPMMERTANLTETGWQAFAEIYGEHDPIVIQYGANTLPGKRYPIVSVTPEVCDHCRRKRLLEWEETNLHVNLEQENQSSKDEIQSFGTRRSTRTKGKTFEVKIKKDMTIKDLKVEILRLTGISPISQALSYEGTMLESSQTIGDVGILDDDEILCIELEETAMDQSAVGVEGFGGTALVGNGDMPVIECPRCTLKNHIGARACEACELAFDEA